MGMNDPNRPHDTATSPGQGNPALPNNADNSNQVNRSGSLQEGVADTASRTADVLTGPDDDTSLRGTAAGSSMMGASTMSTGSAGATGAYSAGSAGMGTYNAGNRYYSPAEGREHLTGLFRTRADAESAVTRLEALGVPRSDISVILRNENETADFAASTGTSGGSHAGEGAGAGSIVGGTVGAILGALAATATSVAIPGVGILLAGPIAGALAGAGAGGLTGGLLGALVGAGIPEDQAKHYEAGLQQGGVVVVADVNSSLAAQARQILNAQGTTSTI